MKNKITNLRISNFKSIREAELDCARINLFVGKPNVGKSNVLEALSILGSNYSFTDKFLSEFIRYDNFSQIFHFQDLSNPIIVNSNIGAAFIAHNYERNNFSFFIGPNNTIESLQTKIISPNKFYEKYKNSDTPILMSGTIEFTGKIDRDQHSEYSPIKKYTFKPNNNIGYRKKSYLLPPNGKNLYSVMETNKRLRDEIPGLFNEYKLEFLIDPERSSFDLIKKENGIYKKIPYSLVADTLQRIIFHYAAIFSNKDSIILFEEPESHSFPPYIRELALKIIESTDNQFFITTHSPYLFDTIVENTAPEDLAIFITYFENYETKFKKLNSDEISKILNYGMEVFFNLNHFVNE
ncbi:MAG TPA: hypothetical protein ENJ95_00770 [Bacteroidetes bacterium]|nr:hypothetical protein [Bacteroidota bacterium]